MMRHRRGNHREDLRGRNTMLLPFSSSSTISPRGSSSSSPCQSKKKTTKKKNKMMDEMQMQQQQKQRGGGSITRSRSEALLHRTRSGLIIKKLPPHSSTTTNYLLTPKALILSHTKGKGSSSTTSPSPSPKEEEEEAGDEIEDQQHHHLIVTTIPSSGASLLHHHIPPNISSSSPMIIKDLRTRRVFSSSPSGISSCCFPHRHDDDDDDDDGNDGDARKKKGPLVAAPSNAAQDIVGISDTNVSTNTSSIQHAPPSNDVRFKEEDKVDNGEEEERILSQVSGSEDEGEEEKTKKGWDGTTRFGPVAAAEISNLKTSSSHQHSCLIAPSSLSSDHPISGGIPSSSSACATDEAMNAEQTDGGYSSSSLQQQQLPSAANNDGDFRVEEGDGHCPSISGSRGIDTFSESDQARKTPALAPCSRLKVFPNPTSHRYRRLLPFLADITKDNLGELEIVSTEHNTKKTKNDLMKKPLALLPASLSQDSTSQRQQETISVQHTKIEDAISEDYGNDPKQVAICEFELLCKSESFKPPTLHEDLTFEELAGINAKHHTGKQQSVGFGHLGSNCTPPVKSILKRPRGGCKGPCPCLDCASFRLHAERAFEFSKKQMHETEDVTTGLIKEFSSLRKLVADFVVPLVGKEGYAILPLNQVQVEDICSRALEAEKVARNRLREMAMALNVHCRITRRMQHKVTFADYWQDKDLG